MATYRKERNNIYFTVEGINGEYHLDINTGVYLGVKGTPIKTVPSKREIVNLLDKWDNTTTNLERVIAMMINHSRTTASFPSYIPYLMSADKVDAYGMPQLYLYEEQYKYVADNLKMLTAYLKIEGNSKTNFNYNNFVRWCEFEKMRSKLGSVANILTADMYRAINSYNNTLTNEEYGVCAYYLVRGKMWEYTNGCIQPLVKYIDLCRAMGKEPQKVNNFMREYVETKQTYELKKTEYDNRAIALNYAKKSKAWEFEFGDFVVSIPTCGQDIVNEGANMHHCVGSYVGDVVEGRTYICFVRRKDTPNDCYITCQVHTNGKIGQYFLAYDRYISTDEDKAFKTAFQNHLYEVWGE